jgi:hypothetical protein
VATRLPKFELGDLDHRLVATSDFSCFLVGQTIEASSRPRIAEALRGSFQKNLEAIWTPSDATPGR